ncbi:ComEC/Rec2 family competence protein [Sphingorhabdus sp.]|jgi:competence protein ComEC|uniref:ComEC/Rec2 family competence protein n=1 Tax=Sphingorhabdus sp. TaxID=1902408 RepID=UPI002BF94F50|nr:ComEC/Rec2 family competence protein [Sphingorhabdus sp.]HMT42338.1 ComEC/Rec2 family competence protein [Sphingorhabdus sp.]
MQFAIDEPISITADHSGGKWFSPIENWLEFEQERLPLLIPVALGLGISIWQVFGAEQGLLVASACAGAALLGLSIGPSSRLKGLMLIGALLLGLGYGAITFKSSLYGAAPLERPWIGRIHGRVESIEDVSARDIVRYRIYVGQHPELPRIIRVNIDKELASPDIAPGSVIEFKVRLMPPPGPALPGSYDFARAAWFGGIGATGRILGPVRIISPPLDRRDFWNNARNALSMRIQMAMGAETGPVGSALLVGTRGSIEDADAEALRNSGMAHLLSVSGLHVTAVVGGTFMLVASLLALWPWLALRVPVPLAAAACAAIIAVLYTLLTGAEVPTVRACIAALLILVALAMGRDALSLRLLAAGATFVLLFWPEALAGPSFQLSFAAVGTIIILHDSTWMRQWMQRRDERLFVRLTRQLSGLLLTGLAIELVLAPIALFHFHKSGLYGALANIAAIPLTTFLVMPAQLLGLLSDVVWSGLGAPFWWVAKQGITAILWIAHSVSAAPGAVALLPEMPVWAFGTATLSGLAIAIFGSRWRWFALGPMLIATITMLSAPRPDMLLTGDGQHLAIIYGDEQLALLRPRAGEYARSMLGETAAIGEEAMALDDMPGAVCNPDGCAFALQKGGRQWRILALRSGYMIPSMELAAACRRSDIVISNRRLPWSCKPRWLKADATLLEQTGGLAFYLANATISSVAEENAHQPWSAYAPHRLQARAERRAKEKAARKASPLSKNVLPKP